MTAEWTDIAERLPKPGARVMLLWVRDPGHWGLSYATFMPMALDHHVWHLEDHKGNVTAKFDMGIVHYWMALPPLPRYRSMHPWLGDGINWLTNKRDQEEPEP